MHIASLTIRRRELVAHDTIEVTLGLGTVRFSFLPGQFVRVTIPRLRYKDPRGNYRDFSIVSSPAERGYITICFRKSLKSGFKRTLAELPLGSKVKVSGPHGSMLLPTDHTPVVCIAGGIGITSFTSKIRYADAKGFNNPITLFRFEKSPKHAAYRQELCELAKKHAETFTLVEKYTDTRFSTTLARRYIQHISKTHFEIAGPPDMVAQVRLVLQKLGVPADHVRFEEYRGYEKKSSLVTSVKLPEQHFKKEDQSRLRGLMQALNKVAVVSETDADGTITFANDILVQISKYSREELLGQNHRMLRSGHHPPEFYERLWQTIKSGKVWRGEIKNRAKDGSYYWVDTSIAPILDTRGVPIKYVSVRFVTTDRKKAEERLRLHRKNLEVRIKTRTSELTALNASLKQEIARRKKLEAELRSHAHTLAENARKKDEFLAVLSHELRNPMAPIVSALDLAKNIAIDEPLVSEQIEVIDRQTQHIVRLLQDLLDVSRIMRGKVEMRLEPIALHTLLAHAVETADPRIKAEDHRLVVTLPEERIMLYADPIRAEQIIVNILHNAAKYTSPGGTISLTAEVDGDMAHIHVQDTGIGLAEGAKEQIFELFAQIDGTLTRSKGGLGIGLSLSRNLARLQGGDITAFSEGKGKGSEFIITLPLDVSMKKEEKKRQVHPDKALPKKQRILVVDDSKEVADALAKVLEILLSQEVRVCYNGTAAVETAQTFKPDIVLLDLAMPGMSGYEVAEQLRKVIKNKSMRIIALSGFGQQEHIERSKQSGFDQYLIKPVTVDHLKTLLGQTEEV